MKNLQNNLSENDIAEIISKDQWMMDVLQAVRALNLPDWWIGAGFVRNKIWDVLHGYMQRTPLNDVDVIYFDETSIDEQKEKEFQKKLEEKMPGVPWSVKNQARMAIVRGDGPYKNASDGLSRWVETATCIGVSLDAHDKLRVTAPHGVSDLTGLLLRPSPAFAKNTAKFYERIQEKKWLTIWPRLKVI